MIRLSREYLRLFLFVLMAVGCLFRADYADPSPQDSAAAAVDSTQENAGAAPADTTAPDQSEIATVAPADSGTVMAIILTISGRPLGVLPVPISSMRAAVSNQLITTLSEQGFTVVPQEKMLAVRREWRVRDGRSIPLGFMENLVDSLAVELLLVADLIVQHDRLIMTARYLNPVSAILLKVNMTEHLIARFPGDAVEGPAAEWLHGAREVSTAVADSSIVEPDSTKGPLLMLDTQSVGCSASVTLIANHALLKSYVEQGDSVLIDPSVVNSTLHDAGFSAKYLGVDARALLLETFAAPNLMVSGLTSYAPASKNRGKFYEDDETLDWVEPLLTDFAMSLRMIDLDTGSITAGKEVFLAASDGVGWFGVRRKDTLMIRLKVTADRLWSDLNNAMEEF